MKQFTTAGIDPWEISITVGSIKRVRDALGVNLYELIDDGAAGLGKLMADPCQLVDILFVLCQKQCQERKLSDEDFGRLFAGDTLQSAVEAFTQELCDFFPQPKDRENLRRVIERGKEVSVKLAEYTERKLAELDVAAEAMKLIKKAEAQAEASNLSPGPSLSDYVGPAPESSELTPAA